MNKEEFKSKKEIINSKIRELNNEMMKLKKEYIKSNENYPIGSKVCVTIPSSVYTILDTLESSAVPESKQYAYIVDYEIDHRDNVVPCLKKVKKDGTASTFNLYVNFENCIIEQV